MTVNPVRGSIAIMPERAGQSIRESQGYAHFLEADFVGLRWCEGGFIARDPPRMPLVETGVLLKIRP